MSTNPVVPPSWIYASKQYSMHSDALSENIAIFRPVKDFYDSRAPATPIKVVIDSNSSFLRPQRSYLSMKITCYNSDGSLNTTANVSSIGAMSCFRTMSTKVGGKLVDTIEDLPTLIADTYQPMTVAQKAYLGYYEGYGNSSVLANSTGSFTVKHFPLASVFNPVNGQPLPICVLPNQALELNLTLNTPQNAFTNAASGSYFVISEVRYVAQLVTPSGQYLSTLWDGIRSGKFLEIDLNGVTQLSNTCSGASQNNFLLPLANARIYGLTHRFRKDSDYTAATGDKALIYTTQGLKAWRYVIGQYRCPLTEDFKIDDTLLIRDLSLADNTSFQSEDIDFDTFFTEQFVFSYAWRSMDEDENSALSLVGSDGNLRLITIHDTAAVPGTDVSLLTTVYTQKTLLIGNTVDVV